MNKGRIKQLLAQFRGIAAVLAVQRHYEVAPHYLHLAGLSRPNAYLPLHI